MQFVCGRMKVFDCIEHTVDLAHKCNMYTLFVYTSGGPIYFTNCAAVLFGVTLSYVAGIVASYYPFSVLYATILFVLWCTCINDYRQARQHTETMEENYREATTSLKMEHDEAIKALKGEHDEAIKALKGEHDEAIKALKREHRVQLLHIQRENKILRLPLRTWEEWGMIRRSLEYLDELEQ